MNLTEHDWELISEALQYLIASKTRMIEAIKSMDDRLGPNSLAFHKQELKELQDTKKKIILTTLE